MTQGAASPVLQATAVVAGYRPDLPILHGVSLHVNAGETVTIIGPNGAGKSTMIKAIAGLVAVSTGQVQLHGKAITNVPAHQLALTGVGYVPQTSNVFTTLTISENLVMGGAALSKAESARRREELFVRYPMLRERQREKAGVLSGGQRQVLAVARALLTKPQLILLDEPTAGLSPKAAAEMFQVVGELSASGVAVLMVEQNAKAALRVSDRAYVMAEGQNRLEGMAQALLNDPAVGEIFLGVRQ